MNETIQREKRIVEYVARGVYCTLTDGYIIPHYVWYEIQIGNE